MLRILTISDEIINITTNNNVLLISVGTINRYQYCFYGKKTDNSIGDLRNSDEAKY